MWISTQKSENNSRKDRDRNLLDLLCGEQVPFLVAAERTSQRGYREKDNGTIMKCATIALLVLTSCLGLVRSFTTINVWQRRRPFHVLQLSRDDNGKANNETTQQDDAPEETASKTLVQQEQEKEDPSLEDQVNTFLDTEFFNPEQVPESSPLKWFADLVQNDYATAEALYASFFIAAMVLITQELVRMQLYGDQYLPFQKMSGAGGGLF